MEETEPERPVHHVHDCSTSQSTQIPVTDAEWAEMRRREQDAITAEQARAAEDDALRAAAAAHPDPLVRALAQRAGIL